MRAQLDKKAITGLDKRRHVLVKIETVMFFQDLGFLHVFPSFFPKDNNFCDFLGPVV